MGQPGDGGAWGVTRGRGESRISSTEILTECRRGVPAESLKLGNTGFARSLADKRRLSQWSTYLQDLQVTLQCRDTLVCDS